MASWHEQANDIREIAALRGISITEAQVAVAVGVHNEGRAYLDAIMRAVKPKKKAKA